MRVDRDLAPEQQRHAAGGAPLLEHPARIGHAPLVLREEQHGHAVVPLVREDLPALLRLLAEEAVRDLEQDAGAVARVALEARAAAVLEVHQDREGVVEDAVAARAVKVGERADTAGVVLELGPVQAARAAAARCGDIGSALLRHGIPLSSRVPARSRGRRGGGGRALGSCVRGPACAGPCGGYGTNARLRRGYTEVSKPRRNEPVTYRKPRRNRMAAVRKDAGPVPASRRRLGAARARDAGGRGTRREGRGGYGARREGRGGRRHEKSPGRVGDRGTAMHGMRARYSSTSSN